MDTLTKNKKVVKHIDFKTISEKMVLKFSTNHSHIVVGATKGWQCCKCKEEMYRDEDNCNWDRCNHRRCGSCRSFQV